MFKEKPGKGLMPNQEGPDSGAWKVDWVEQGEARAWWLGARKED